VLRVQTHAELVDDGMRVGIDHVDVVRLQVWDVDPAEIARKPRAHLVRGRLAVEVGRVDDGGMPGTVATAAGALRILRSDGDRGERTCGRARSGQQSRDSCRRRGSRRITGARRICDRGYGLRDDEVDTDLTEPAPPAVDRR
jgi:hypothetical protein